MVGAVRQIAKLAWCRGARRWVVLLGSASGGEKSLLAPSGGGGVAGHWGPFLFDSSAPGHAAGKGLLLEGPRGSPAQRPPLRLGLAGLDPRSP